MGVIRHSELSTGDGAFRLDILLEIEQNSGSFGRLEPDHLHDYSRFACHGRYRLTFQAMSLDLDESQRILVERDRSIEVTDGNRDMIQFRYQPHNSHSSM